MTIEGLPRSVLDALDEGCQVIDHDFRYLYLNDAVIAHARKPREDLLGRTMTECYPGIETTPLFAEIARCLRDRVSHRMDNAFDFEGGRRVVFELRMVPVPEGLCVLSVDVTERRAFLSAVVTDTDDAILGANVEGRVTFWNEAAQRIFGWTRSEALGRNADFLIPESAREAERERWARLARGERIGHFTTRRLAKDGTEIGVSITLSPVHDHTGRIVGFSKILRDVREASARERALVAAKETAEAATKELEAFSYSVAHDLRAPLRAIDGFSQALIEDCSEQLDDTGRRYLGLVRDSSQLMAELIDDLLSLSRVTRQELSREEVSITKEARTILQRLTLREPRRRVEAKVADGLVTRADRRLVQVLLENLLGNAWKFTSKREVAHIEVGLEQHRGFPAFFVRDDGAGFDMAYADKLFGVFSRLHPASEFEGTGIGLATVQRIAHRHHGEVWGEGRPGGGACFRFVLEAPAAPSEVCS